MNFDSLLEVNSRKISQHLTNSTAMECRRCFSSLLGSLRNDDGDGNENGKKEIGLLRKTTTLHVHHAFWYISLPSFHDYNVKTPNFPFCRGREQKTTTFFFFSWNLMQSLRIQLQKKLLTFDEFNEME